MLIKFWLEVERRGAEATLRGAHHGPAAPVEAEPDGPALAEPMVRVLAGARHDARGDGHEVRALAHRALGRQEASPPQLHPPPARADPLQEGAAQEGEAPQALRRRTPTTTRRRSRAGGSCRRSTNQTHLRFSVEYRLANRKEADSRKDAKHAK